MDLPKTADVVVIGGGPAGAAAVWALHCMDPTLKTVLLEQNDTLGSGSSLASLEAFRTCWPATCLAEQMKRSMTVFHDSDAYLGEGAAQSIALKQNGYLFCAFTEDYAATLKADVDYLHKIGLDHIEYLSGEEVQKRFSWVGPQVIAAKFDPIAGWLDSSALIHAFVRTATSSQTILNVKDTCILTEAGRVVGVEMLAGKIATSNVLIAAGAGSRAIGRTAGVELPIVMIPRQSFTTGWRHKEFPSHSPMVIGAPPHPHCHPEADSGMIFGWEYHWNNKWVEQDMRSGVHESLIEPVPLSGLKDARFPSIVLALLARQFGHDFGEGFASPDYLRGIYHNIGYYVYRDHTTAYRTDDDGTQHPYESERAIIDAHPDIDGLYVSIAHVGHGIMTAPAAGEIAASHILDQPLPHPSFADFGFDVPWVAYDEGVL